MDSILEQPLKYDGGLHLRLWIWSKGERAVSLQKGAAKTVFPVFFFLQGVPFTLGQNSTRHGMHLAVCPALPCLVEPLLNPRMYCTVSQRGAVIAAATWHASRCLILLSLPPLNPAKPCCSLVCTALSCSEGQQLQQLYGAPAGA